MLKSKLFLTTEKFVFAEDIIEFAGFDITPTKYKPPSKMIKAIQDSLSPLNITGVRSWFRLVNQISYAFSIHFYAFSIIASFRELLEKKVDSSIGIIR